MFLSSRLSVENRQTTVAFPQKSLIRTMADEKFLFWKRVGIVSLLLVMLWAIHFLQYFHLANFDQLGNMPGKVEGLPGILFSPFLHGNTNTAVSMHLLSNSLPILLLFTLLLHTFPRHTIFIWLFIQLVSGSLLWVFGTRGTMHVGISGIVYGLTGFFLSSGLFRKDRTSLLIAALVAVLYGSSVIGFLPKEGVSWQSHLFGFMSGIVAAYFTRQINLPKVEPNDEDELHFFERLERARAQQKAESGNEPAPSTHSN